MLPKGREGCGIGQKKINSIWYKSIQIIEQTNIGYGAMLSKK